MKKKDLYGDNLKEQLTAGARDKAYAFIMADNQVRGCLINATKMIHEMKANHQLGVLETLTLGHAYIAAALAASGLKGNDRLSLQIDCSGPIKGLVAEANAFGEVRGYLKNVPIPIDKPLENFNLSPFFGAGFLTVTKYLEDARQPFSGQVEMLYGSIAKDLTYYYSKSEQVPTSVTLSVSFDQKGEVSGAGGLLVQVLPGAADAVVDKLEEWVSKLPSLGRYVLETDDITALLQDAFPGSNPRILSSKRVEFMCHCNPNRMKQYLQMLPPADLNDLVKNGPFPLELVCHYCNTKYHFSEPELQAIQKKA